MDAGATGAAEGGGDGILGMSAVCSLTVGFATAVDADDGAGMAAGEVAVGGEGIGAVATVDEACPMGWARTVGGGTTGAAGLVAPGTLPVVFFSREVSFFGTIGMAATVAASFAGPAVVPAGGAPPLEGGTGRGGNVMRTVSFFSCLAASPAEGVSAIITSQFRRSIATDPDLSKFFSRRDARGAQLGTRTKEEMREATPHPAFGHPLPIRWGEGQGEGPSECDSLMVQMAHVPNCAHARESHLPGPARKLPTASLVRRARL